MAHAIQPSLALLRGTHKAIAPTSQHRNIPRSDPSEYGTSGSQKSSSSSRNVSSNHDKGDHYRPSPLRRNENAQSIYDDTSRRRSRSPVRDCDSSVSRSLYTGSSRRRSRSPPRITSSRTHGHENEVSSNYTDDNASCRRSRSSTSYYTSDRSRTQSHAADGHGTRPSGMNYDDNGSSTTLFARPRNADNDSDYSSAYPSKYADSTARRLVRYGEDDTSDCRSSIRGSRRPYITMRESNTFVYHEFAKHEFEPGVIILAPLHEEDFRRTPRPSYRESSVAMSHRSGQKSHISHTDFGVIYSETRFHIVVETHGSIYETIPLYTYKNKGLLYKNRNEYASIVDHRYPELSKREAPRALVTGHLQHGVEAMRSCSVAHLVHPVSRQYNCQVRYIGQIRDADVPLLVELYRNRHKLSEESA